MKQYSTNITQFYYYKPYFETSMKKNRLQL